VNDTPRYLRFARALALASVLAPGASGCCPLVPDSIACGHCTCAWAAGHTASQPVSCATIGREAICCPPPPVGPLAPPSLSS
jgi:hypothetical protein